MAIDALKTFLMGRIIPTNMGKVRNVDRVDMTPNTILLHHALSRLPNTNDLRLCSQSKNRGVIEPVSGFEIVMPEDIVLRYVAVVARGYRSMCALCPRRVLRGHHMAIDARFRRIR